MKIELKNIKLNLQLSEETNCFSATIYIDGKKAGTCGNHGHGGPNMYHFDDREVERRFEEFIKSQPPIPPDPDDPPELGELPMDADIYIGGIVESWAEKQELKRLCKKHAVFRLKDHQYGPGEWTTIRGTWSPKLKEHLVKTYGENLGEIVNETI